jgi:hypothetical protein
MSPTQAEAARQRARDEYWQDPEAARARIREAGQRFYRRHPERVLADTRAQQLKKQRRTPSWADLVAIRAFYEACPPGHEVDHIYPLNGKLVSGLHVLENLQYLPWRENRSKGNRS